VHAADTTGHRRGDASATITSCSTLPEEALDAVNSRSRRTGKGYHRDPKRRRRVDEGTLQLIDNQITSATGTLKLKASSAPPQCALAGQFVNAGIGATVVT